MSTMKSIVVLTLTILAIGHVKPIESQVAVKQKFVLNMLQQIYLDDELAIKYETSYYEYKPWEHVGDFNHEEKLQVFLELWQHNPFQDNQVWNVMSDDQAKYAVGLVRLFYSAKNWEIFQHAAFWARQNVNKDLFAYAFTIVSMFREDMKGIVLPDQYETLKPEFLRAFGKNVFIFKMT